MRLGRLRLFGACAAVLVLVTAGCGGSGALSRADFTQQANAVCRQALKTARGRAFNATEIAEEYVALERAKAEGVGALKPPKELQARVDQYVATATAMRGLLEQAVAALHAKQSLSSITSRSGAMLHKEEVLAVGLGLDACVERGPHGKRAH